LGEEVEDDFEDEYYDQNNSGDINSVNYLQQQNDYDDEMDEVDDLDLGSLNNIDEQAGFGE